MGVQAGAATSTSRWKYNNSNFYDATETPIRNRFPALTSTIRAASWGCRADVTARSAIGGWSASRARGSRNPMNEHNFKPGFFPAPTANSEVITTNIQSVMSVTGRIGFAPSADWLLYGKGGYAAARIDTNGSVTPALSVSNLDFTTTNWHNGWTVGAGAEYRLFRNITLGLEYDYYRFNSVQHVGGISALDTLLDGSTRPASPILHSVNARRANADGTHQCRLRYTGLTRRWPLRRLCRLFEGAAAGATRRHLFGFRHDGNEGLFVGWNARRQCVCR